MVFVQLASSDTFVGEQLSALQNLKTRLWLERSSIEGLPLLEISLLVAFFFVDYVNQRLAVNEAAQILLNRSDHAHAILV